MSDYRPGVPVCNCCNIHNLIKGAPIAKGEFKGLLLVSSDSFGTTRFVTIIRGSLASNFKSW